MCAFQAKIQTGFWRILWETQADLVMLVNNDNLLLKSLFRDEIVKVCMYVLFWKKLAHLSRTGKTCRGY